MNIRLDIEYDGADYHGWQRQAGAPTIQETLEDCVEKISGTRTPVIGAGRTDSGVHACGQVANFLTHSSLPPEKWALALNTRLPHTIRVLKSQEADAKFHAQKSAVAKLYEYRVLNRNYSSALDRRVYFWPQPMLWDRVVDALPLFLGTHDYRAFQTGPQTVTDTVRTIYRFDLSRTPGGIYTFEIEGSGFLRQMVRNMVGTVLEVGQGIRDPSTITAAFVSRDRTKIGRAVPARGLTLIWVKYPN